MLSAVLLSAALVGCTDAPEQLPFVEETTSSTAIDREAMKPTIRIGVAGWRAAQLNAAVADQLVERRLGYPVERVPIDDFGAMFQDLERGDLHAVLEIWPTSLVDRERLYLETGRVASFGELGVEGRLGWYVPVATAQALGIEGWENLAEPAVAESFAHPSTEGAPRFLGINPSYVQFDQHIIDELNLPFQVLFSGSESSTEAEVDAAVAQEEPILFYWWTPTELAARHDLVRVELPQSSDGECEAEPTSNLRSSTTVLPPVGCLYLGERLIKVGAPALAETAPEVAEVFEAFTLTTDDQHMMLALVADGLTVDEAASQWIDDNADRWEPWFDQ